MKKPKRALLSAALLAFVLLSGCRTSNISSLGAADGGISALSILEEDAALYLKCEVRGNERLLSRIISDVSPGLSERDAERALESITSRNGAGTFYASCGRREGALAIDCVIETSVTESALRAALTKENGWERSYYRDGARRIAVYENAASGFALSLVPVSTKGSVLLASKDVKPLLENYLNILRGESLGELPERFQAYLYGEKGDISFYFPSPSRALSALLGQGVNLGPEAVYGAARKRHPASSALRAGSPGSYNLSLSVSFENTRSVTVLRSLLALSHAAEEFALDQPDDYTLRISGIEIPENGFIVLLFGEMISQAAPLK